MNDYELKLYQANRRFELMTMFRDRLRELDITKQTLAYLLCVKEGEVSKWLSGNHNIKMDTVNAIQFHLGIE